MLVINNGRLVADDNPTHLAALLTGEHKLLFRVAGPQNQVVARLRAIDGVKSVTPTIEAEPGAFDYQVESAENVDIRRPAFFALAQAGYPVLRLTNQDLSLEEVFVRLTENKPSVRPEKKKKTADDPSAQEEKQQ